jgi:hypothetical protein
MERILGASETQIKLAESLGLQVDGNIITFETKGDRKAFDEMVLAQTNLPSAA